MSIVLAAIDNSAQARSVLEVAKEVADALGVDAEAVHVTQDGHETATASTAAAGVPLRVVSGDPVAQLSAAASADGVLATVMGLRDRSGGPRPGGHTVLAVADRALAPVVVVPPDVEVGRPLTTVLVAVDADPDESAVLSRTVDIARGTELEIVIVHVDEEIPSFTDQVQHEVEAYVHDYVAHGDPTLRGIRLELRLGVAADEVLAVVESVRPGLVALGWPGAARPERGAVAREIVARCPVPVLLVGEIPSS